MRADRAARAAAPTDGTYELATGLLDYTSGRVLTEFSTNALRIAKTGTVQVTHGGGAFHVSVTDMPFDKENDYEPAVIVSGEVICP